MNFDQAFDMLIGHEGGYSNHPSDPGAETMWGVTSRVARANGYQGNMRMLTRETAKDIYRKCYWDMVRAEQMPAQLRFSLFDAAVNSGVAQATRWLQRALDVGEDGVMGPLTIEAAQRSDGLRLAVRLNAERLEFMTGLPTWGMFSRGWARRVVANLREVVA